MPPTSKKNQSIARFCAFKCVLLSVPFRFELSSLVSDSTKCDSRKGGGVWRWFFYASTAKPSSSFRRMALNHMYNKMKTKPMLQSAPSQVVLTNGSSHQHSQSNNRTLGAIESLRKEAFYVTSFVRFPFTFFFSHSFHSLSSLPMRLHLIFFSANTFVLWKGISFSCVIVCSCVVFSFFVAARFFSPPPQSLWPCG